MKMVVNLIQSNVLKISAHVFYSPLFKDNAACCKEFSQICQHILTYPLILYNNNNNCFITLSKYPPK